MIAVALDHDHLHLRNEVLAYGLDTLRTPLLFQFVLLSTGKKFIVVLNHPKGNSSPTQPDKALMARLQRGARELSIDFVDYVIVGAHSYWSKAIQKTTRTRGAPRKAS